MFVDFTDRFDEWFSAILFDLAEIPAYGSIIKVQFMGDLRMAMMDGNEAVARIAHQTNEVIAIYPITPASPMGELSDAWSAAGRKNIWGSVPEIIEMQSEAGAAGAIHGALQSGALSTTFTASQGLLLMIPNMYKIAGELTPTVFHVSARTLATHALSIFGDHSDVMAVRGTGFAMLAASSVQEAHDFALISQAASLSTRLPFVHFFDGFRTSHEINQVEEIELEVIHSMMGERRIHQHRQRALNPDHPVVRGTSQNPDTFFQQREAITPWYQQAPNLVKATMERFALLTGRRYRPFEYVGAVDAERVVILMGSGVGAVEETVEHLTARGEKVGVIKVRLYRPFSPHYLLEVLPETVKQIAVLDRIKEPGADGEPLYKDVVTALAMHSGSGELWPHPMPKVVGGRYGISSKEFTPAMVKAVFEMLTQSRLKNSFTIGIEDDVSDSSLAWDESFKPDAVKNQFKALFYGLGSDGTVSANRNAIKIIGEQSNHQGQGYFVYDSKKTGAVTVSHLRFGTELIRSSYLITPGEADFVACHQERFLQRYPMLEMAKPGAVFLLNSAQPADQLWDSLPRTVQQTIIDKSLRFYAIDAVTTAAEAGMGKRINTVMQSCFFAISEVLPREQAIAAMKQAVQVSYGKKGEAVVQQNFDAIDAALDHLHSITVPATVTSKLELKPTVSGDAPEFVQQVTGRLIAGEGDQLPVSAFPYDGTWPVGTTQWEKRNLAFEIPLWDESICIDCGKCPFVCPHSAIRSKVLDLDHAATAPEGFKYAPVKGKEFAAETQISYQVAPEDCTGCGLCVEICPVHDKQNPEHKALNMVSLESDLLEQERSSWAFFKSLPEYDRTLVRASTLKGAMLFQPLFEFSGACTGCAETPYVRLTSQLFGERMVVANATGCSSIYGGNLPTTPWTVTTEGRGPAWSNSLFEDNAEFGMGMRAALDHQWDEVREKLQMMQKEIEAELGEAFVEQLLSRDQTSESGIYQQRQAVEQLSERLKQIDSDEAQLLEALIDVLVRRSVWIIGGDGWAYDIGFGGVDHALASGRDVNILVLDTEVYSNTGGQTSKATPRGAVAKFSAGGKTSAKKNLADVAISYGNVYVAQVAYGAKDMQTLKTFLEAESYPGTSIIIAYAPCIAQGVDMTENHSRQRLAVESGHWPLFRYDPRRREQGKNPMQLDSKAPKIPYADFIQGEGRFSVLMRSQPEVAAALQKQAEEEISARYQHYKRLAEEEVTA
jgi:pyruvate-ferredoxin/flavodoxin oxidoreductase